MAWTKEQELAIITRGKNIIVSAGAGSGKTAVLSERALDYCKSGNDIRKLLVLTFTKAAASEMKERIRKKLLENHLDLQASYIDAAYITTFDAYSLALVKKYNYVLGLSKDLSIMDGALVGIKKAEIARRIFDSFYGEENQDFFRLLRKYSKQDDKDILKIVLDLCDKLDLVIDFEEFVSTYEAKFFNTNKLVSIVGEYEGIAKEKISDFIYSLSELINIASSDEKAIKKLDELQVLASSFNGLSTYDQLASVMINAKFPSIPPKTSEAIKEVWYATKNQLDELKKKIFAKYTSTKDMLDELSGLKEDVLFILKVCKMVNDELMKYKIEVMMFDYTDIAKFAIKLVSEQEAIRLELTKSYNEIMIDEYQDTSDIQETFINYIANNNLYMVGDIKQSIYRFRNANPYIFKNKYDSYANLVGGMKIDLNKNFRSRSEVLDDINALFTSIMTNSCGDADYKVEHKMNFGLTDYDMLKQSANFNLENITYDKSGYDAYDKEEIEAFIIASKITELKASGVKVYDKDAKDYRSLRYNDIAILISNAKSFTTFKQIFEYLNIPLSIEADLDLKDSYLPQLFANILYLISYDINLEDAKYRHALASILRSFIYEETDEVIFKVLNKAEPHNIFEDINYFKSLYEISYHDLFMAIVNRLDIYNKIAKIGDVTNSIVVLEYVHNIFETVGATSMSISEASEYLENVINSSLKLTYKLKSEAKDSVRIMTIHKSKGLEFPYCFFPMLSMQFNKADQRSSTGFYKDYGIYIPYADEGKSDTIVKSLVAKKINEADISEKVRLLYVALTRAREKMYLITEEKEYNNLNPKKFNSFDQMIAYSKVFDNVKNHLDLALVGLTPNYKKQISSSSLTAGKKRLEYAKLDEIAPLTKTKISKEMKNIITDTLRDNINLGLEMHACLEVLDFNNPDVDSLPTTDFVKDTLKEVLKLDIMESLKNAKTYHELEFYFNEGENSYHGIIDLLAVYDDHVDIIDYKLSNTESDEYKHQLSVYKKFIESKSDLPINLYLLSLINKKASKIEI